MRVIVNDDLAKLGEMAGEQIVDALVEVEVPVLGLATGSSPLPIYAYLRGLHAAGKLDLSDVRAFALDEYIGIAADHPERYRNVLCSEMVWDDATGLKEENLTTPDALAEDPQVACEEYEAAIVASGGVDVQILGIGTDGHIAFNEPGGSLRSLTHIDNLTEQTISDNARFFDGDLSKVPTQCITQGLDTIMRARKLVMIVNGANKAEAVFQTVCGPVSALWPSTILQFHRDITIYCDEAAASKLPAEFITRA